MVTPNEFEQATARAQRVSGPKAINARYDVQCEKVIVGLSNGAEFRFPPKAAQGLEEAKSEDLTQIEISPSGLGLYFPALDADLFLPALLDGIFGSPKWAASRLGSEGGKQRSEAKAASSRSNGKRGGRPKKVAS